MTEQKQKGQFKLIVPLDASGIEDFKPEQEPKVVVKDRKGTLHSQKVKLDNKGHGAATFTFDESPGEVGVFIGPAEASDEEMIGLQTISFNVSTRKWAEKPELKLPPFQIPPYYWHWWLRWCRTFTIRGRVVCADGSPVPGAKVCAYDVDRWWFWMSKQLVGCATTNMFGAFEIKFRWCCGWWPWWWWRFRDWYRDPLLVKRISDTMLLHPDVRLLPTASHQPTLEVFNTLLAKEGLDTHRALSPNDVNKLEQIRTRLLAKLPFAPELECLHIWPWYPWYPWWDCTPDIIFKVTQDCHVLGTVIVNEGVGDTRWNIPNPLDVTLIANDKAFCLHPCPDPPCESGRCLTFAHVCYSPITSIGGNPGASPNPVGYLNPNNLTPGTAGFNSDRPFGGVVHAWKNSGDMVGVDYYEIEYNDGLGWKPLPVGAGLAIYRYWLFWDGDWHSGYEVFPYDSTKFPGHTVYESREHFEVTGPYSDWFPGGGNRIWVYGEYLVMSLNSIKFPDGTYHFRVKGYGVDASNHLVNEVVLPCCGTEVENDLVLTFDNRVIDSSLYTADNPCTDDILDCTVHICTTEPSTDFLSVRIDGKEVDPCDVVNTPTGMLEIKFQAYDPGNHLGGYSLFAKYKENLWVNLLSLLSEPEASLVSLSGGQVGPTYGEALGQGATAPYWNGGTMLLTVPAARAFLEPCCYQLELRAWKRTVVDCDHDYEHCNLSEYTLGVGVCPPLTHRPIPIAEAISGKEPVIEQK